MLEREELMRYNRQIILPEIGVKGQEKLNAASVLMIGAGGLGCPILQYLVAAGVGTIGIIDNDVVDMSNLHRQVLYSMADIGKPKASTVKQKLELLNPFIGLTAYDEKLTVENALRLIGMYDLIIDGSDNFTTRYLVNDTCVALNKTLVFGAIFKFEGHVSVFNYNNGPNYRDVFPEAPPEGEVPNCAEIGVIGVLPGIIGTYMANEAIKIICEIGETLSGKLFTIDALNNTHHIFKINVENHPVQSKAAVSQVITIGSGITVVKEISFNKLMFLLYNKADEVCLVDVREEYEYEDYNVGGINIPFYELAERLAILPKDKTLIFCCKTGQRSKMAVEIARPFFNGELYSVKSGII